MKKNSRFLLLAFLSVVASCVRDGQDLSKCERHLRIELEWIGTNPRFENELIDIAVFPPGGGEIDLVSDRYGTDADLPPEYYEIIGWEPLENASVNHRIVSVPLRDDGMVEEPKPFSAGYTTAQVYEDIEFQVIPLPMYLQTRELIIMVRFPDQTPISVEATLDGVVEARDILNGFPPVPQHNRPYAMKRGMIGYEFQEDTGEGREGWFVGHRMLLGIDGDTNQTLGLTVTLPDGETESGVVDVTGMLTGFHTSQLPYPWYIILDIDVSIDFDFTIADWESGAEIDLIAN